MRLPMTKGGVKGLDTMAAFMMSDKGKFTPRKLTRFGIAGASQY